MTARSIEIILTFENLHVLSLCATDSPSQMLGTDKRALERLLSRFGLAVRRLAGKRKGLGSIPLRLSFLFKSCGLWTPCDFVPHNYETLKWLSSLSTLMLESFWW